MMKWNLGVFFGGASVEHEVSVISALQAIRNMKGEEYEIHGIYITKDGRFFTGDKVKDIENYKDIPALLKQSTQVTLTKKDGQVKLVELCPKRFRKPMEQTIDFAFPIVHGTNCEDGSLQGYFEVLGLPYAGCDVVSSAVGMDKVLFKQVMKENGLPVVEGVSFYARDFVRNQEKWVEEIEKLGYPVIVKPANLGSSVGISKADNRSALLEKINLAASFASKLLVEKAVTGLREINCSVVGDVNNCTPSVCEEPVMSDEILSYTDKYQRGGGKSKNSGMASLDRLIPAPIDEEKRQEICNLSCDVFKALGCNGVVRIDYLMDTNDNNKVYVNEINTIPGSLAFYLWEAKGVKYPDLLEQVIECGKKRQREKEQLMFTYDTNILEGGSFGAKGCKK
jgi:D-alanine-D-alanine ligase